MKFVKLYGTEGIKDGDEIRFSIDFQPNVFNKIEDQGEFSSDNIRTLLFKRLDKEHKIIYLSFKYKELKPYDSKQKYDQHFPKLLYQALKQIFELNKNQQKLSSFQEENLLLTIDNYLFFLHFEHDKKKNFINEIETLKYIINSHYSLQQNEGQQDWRKIQGYTKMSEILNDQLIVALLQNFYKRKEFQNIKDFYQLQEKYQNISFYQQIYTFPKSCSIDFQQRNDLELKLFQINFTKIILQDILEHDEQLRKLFESLMSAIIKYLIQSLQPKEYYGLSCLQLTLDYYNLQVKQDDTFNESSIQSPTQKQLERIQRCFNNRQNIYQDKKYLLLQDLFQLIERIEKKNDPIYSQIQEKESLPFNVGYQELLIQYFSQISQELRNNFQ